EGVPVGEEDRKEVRRAGCVDLGLHSRLAEQSAQGGSPGENPHFGAVGTVAGAPGEGGRQEPEAEKRAPGPPLTSKRFRADRRSRGLTPLSPSVGTTMIFVPRSTSAILSPTRFSAPTPRSASFSSRVPSASARDTASSPAARCRRE